MSYNSYDKIISIIARNPKYHSHPEIRELLDKYFRETNPRRKEYYARKIIRLFERIIGLEPKLKCKQYSGIEEIYIVTKTINQLSIVTGCTMKVHDILDYTGAPARTYDCLMIKDGETIGYYIQWSHINGDEIVVCVKSKYKYVIEAIDSKIKEKSKSTSK